MNSIELEGIIRSLEKNGLEDPSFSHELIKQTRSNFEHIKDFSKFDQQLGIAFGGIGICGFIKLKIGEKAFEQSKNEGLELIKYILELRHDVAKRHIFFHLKDFKVVSYLLCFNSNESSKVKQSALACLISLFEAYKVDLTEFEVGEMYWNLLTSSEKSSFVPSVRGKMLHLLGVLAKISSRDFLSKKELYIQLFNHFVVSIKSQVESKDRHMEANILLGCIKGLDSFLFAYHSKIMENNTGKLNEFYEKLEQIIDPKCSIENDSETVKLKRREFQRAGLELIAHHGEMFRAHFYKYYQQWFADLLAWTKSSNSDDARVGRRSMFKFMDEIIGYIQEISCDETQREYLIKLNNFLLLKFKSILDTKSSRGEISISIKGIGMLSEILEDPELKIELLDKIIEQIEAFIIELNGPSDEKYRTSLSIVPTYVEAVGRMLFSFEIRDDGDLMEFEKRLSVIEQLVVILITRFPEMNEPTRAIAHFGLSKLTLSLYEKHRKYVDGFLSRIFQDSLTHIIASPTRAESDLITESLNRSTGVNKRKSYFKTVSSFTPFCINLILRNGNAKNQVEQIIFDSIMEWSLNTIRKLDLSLEFNEEVENFDELTSSDPIYNLKANKERDFQLFMNLVIFLQEFVGSSDAVYFKKWIGIWIREMIVFIKEHSLVSGFYKILALVYEVCRKLKYFEDNTIEENDEIFAESCLFLKKVSLKIQEFRDDLLISILDLWLSVPNQIMLQNMDALGSTLQVVFMTGKNSFALASKGIFALDRWFQIEHFEYSKMEELFKNLFPIWKSYFTFTGVEVKVEIDSLKKKSKSRINERFEKRSNELEGTSLQKVQLDILKFIGSYGYLLNIDADSEEIIGISTEQKFLKYSIPFQDIKPDLQLDYFLPRIFELCESSSQRQSRSAACEFLHSLILYFLGFSVKESSNDDLFLQLFRTMMKLGCDSDVIVRQLFNPLCIQTIHWFTRDSKGAGLHFGSLILTLIMEGLVQNENVGYRDFSSVCLSEYFRFSKKYANKEQVKNVMKSLYNASTHASYQYRQGSVLGFNSIYREFREDQNLINIYTFQLFKSYLLSLSLSKDLEDDSILIRTTKQALKHLERIVDKKKSFFNINVRERIVPSGFEGPLLKNMVEWIFLQCGNSVYPCRFEAIRLVRSLSYLIKDIGSIQSFIEKYVSEKGFDGIIKIAESSLNSQITMNEIDGPTDFYVFLAPYCNVENLLVNPNSRFISCFENCLKSSFENDVGFKIFAKLSTIFTPQIITNFDDSTKIYILKKSFSISKSFGNDLESFEKLLLLWTLLWNDLKDTLKGEEIKLELKQEMIFSLQRTEKSMLEDVKWFILISGSDFFNQFIDEFNKEELRNSIWVFIMSSIYHKVSNTNWETNYVSPKLRTLLNELLRLEITLQYPNSKIVEACFDPTLLKIRGSGYLGQKITKGEFFQQIFISAIPHCPSMTYLSQLITEKSLERVGLLVQNLLTAFRNEKTLRRKFGSNIVKESLEIWTQLSLNCDRKMLERIVCGLASIDMKSCQNSIVLAKWWAGPDLMSSEHLSIKEKSEFIHYFGLFASSTNLEILSLIVTAVDEFMKRDLSKSLAWGEDEMYIVKVQGKILSFYDAINNEDLKIKLVQILTGFTGKMGNYVEDHKSFNSTRNKVKVLVEKSNERFQLKLANSIYSMFESNADGCKSNLIASRTILIPILNAMKPSQLKEFTFAHMGNILSSLRKECKSTLDWTDKTISFNLIELLCYKPENLIQSEELKEKLQEKDNLIKTLFGICNLTKKSKAFEIRDDKLCSACSKCNAASYNAISALTNKTQYAEKFYSGFLLKESPTDIIWKNFIDCSTTYKYPIVFEKPPDPEEANEAKGVPMIEKRVIGNVRNAVLAGSSLAVDATTYDFTDQVTAEGIYNYILTLMPKSARAKATEIKTMDWNEINKHDCMLPLVSTFKKLATFPQDSSISVRWFDFVKLSIEGPTVHENIKAFLLSAIINCKDVFQPFASMFGDIIVKTITSGNFGGELNHFVKELIIMLLEWEEKERGKSNAEPILKPISALRLVQFLIKTVANERLDIFNQNLQILEAVTRAFVKDNNLPYEGISEEIRTSNIVGFNVSKHILLAGHLPFKLEDSNIREFARCLFTGFTSTLQKIYIPAAQVWGLILRHLREKEYSAIVDTENRVQKELDKTRSRQSSFFHILSSIVKFYPSFLPRNKQSIFEFLKPSKSQQSSIPLLPKLLVEEMKENPDDIRTIVSNFYKDLDGRNIFTATQLEDEIELKGGIHLLKIFNENLEANEKQMAKVIKWADGAQMSKNDKIRKDFASVLGSIHDKFSCEGKEKIQLVIKIEKFFVRFYNDDSEEVRSVVNQFWEKILKMKEKTPYVMLELLESLADEPNSLKIALDLVIMRCRESPDFNKQIFDKPLAECQFQEYHLDTSWRNRLSSFQPLFAESLTSSQTFKALPKHFQSSITSQCFGSTNLVMNILRETLQNPQFSVTQESIDASINYSSQFMEIDENRFPSEQSMEIDEMVENNENESSLGILRRKFYARPEANSGYYGEREIARQERRVEEGVEEVKKKFSSVRLTRSYRIGELPDIEMKNSDFLNAFKSLAQEDEVLARIFLTHLFRGMKKELNSKDAERFTTKISLVIDSIVSKYFSVLNSNFAGLLIEIATENNVQTERSTISKLSRAFGFQHLGILKFEKDLENFDGLVSKTKRARIQGMEENIEAEMWLRIAELYKDLNDFDTVRNVFSHIAIKNPEKAEMNNNVKEALYYESVGSYNEARNVYESLLKNLKDIEDQNEINVSFWEEGVDKCLIELSDWKKLFKKSTKVYTSIPDRENVFDNQRYVSKVLPYHLQSGFQMCLRYGIFDEFKNLLDKIQENEEMRKFALSNYAIDMGIFASIEDDWSRGGVLLDTAWESSLKAFQTFSRSSLLQKKRIMESIQKAALFQDSVDFVQVSSIKGMEPCVKNIVTKWKKSIMGLTVPLVTSDTLSAQIVQFGVAISGLLKENVEGSEGLIQELNELCFNQYLWVVKLAIFHGNSTLANKYLNSSQKIGDNLDESVKFGWRKEFCRFLATFKNFEGWGHMWASGWKKLNKLDNEVNILDVKSDLLYSLIQMASNETKKITREEEHKIKKELEIHRSGSIIQQAIEKGRELMISATTNDDWGPMNGESYMKFYHLLDLMLEKNEKGENKVELEKHKLICLLKSFKVGNKEAMQIFPSCFHSLEIMPELHSTFVEWVSQISSWIFLPWLDQIMTNCKQIPILASLLKPIIDNVYDDYPQAFQLEYPEFIETKKVGFRSEYSKSLKAILTPKMFLVKSFPRIPSELKATLLQIKDKIEEILSDEFIYGKFHQEFAQEVQSVVIYSLERLDTILERFSECKSQIPEVEEIRKELMQTFSRYDLSWCKSLTKELSMFSPWLSNFHFTSCTDQLEIPGLYSKFLHHAPNVDLYPKIVSFHPIVMMLLSKTRPFQLTMLGNDGKKYKFLVKLDDDMKQDKRIQQLFKLSNEIFQNDPNCLKRGLNLQTYSVIPMSDNFGLIEWVDRTEPLRRFIIKTNEQKQAYETSSKEYRTWGDVMGKYGKLSGKPRSEIEADYNIKLNQMPSKYMRENLLESSLSLEEYYKIRERLIRSYATMCLVHYIFGIGDRHLENCLVSFKRGEFLGIDFGYAFGTGTHSLPVPELIPFRLTPQLQFLLAPYGPNGLFKETMLFVLRAIVKNADLISAVTEIFVREPTMNWVRSAKEHKGFQFTVPEAGENIQSFFPIEILKEKLRLGNPARLIISELKMQRNPQYVPNWIRVVEDGRDTESKYFDEEDVVDTLLSLATDKNLLGRTYYGWSPWV